MNATTLDALMALADAYSDAAYNCDERLSVLCRRELQSALSEALALTRCACGDSFTATDPGKCVNCRAADGEALADKVQPAADPMDWPLPCDVRVGHGTNRKGTSLRALVARMQVLYDMVHDRKAAPPVAPAAPVAPQTEPVAWIDPVDADQTLPHDGWCVVHREQRSSTWKPLHYAAPPQPVAAPPAPAAAPAEGARHIDCDTCRHLLPAPERCARPNCRGRIDWEPLSAAPTEAPNA